MTTLKYLFIAEFTDGSKIEQNPQDKPIDPKGRNCYSDVLAAVASGKRIKMFSLYEQKLPDVPFDANNVHVDLINGVFNVNGLNILLESEKLPAMPDHFDLVWYHQVTRNQNVTYEKKTGNIIKREELPEFREYFIGWQCTINGKNYTQKLAVA